MRTAIFADFARHPWLGRVFAKLTVAELELAAAFLLKNEDLGIGEFEMAVNRMFLDRQRPKHWKEIQELLTCCNSATRVR